MVRSKTCSLGVSRPAASETLMRSEKPRFFPASDATIFVNGTELFVDGGGAQI
jgi:hypothetical protein